MLLFICFVLMVIIIALLIKIAFMHKSCDEILNTLTDILSDDTNSLITVSSSDKKIRKLAARLNQELQLLKKERHKFQTGDLQLRESITNISHDLRTPLTAISGYLSLLKKQKLDEKSMYYAQIIENRTEALEQLTEEIFRYSIINSDMDSFTLEEISMNRALEDCIAANYANLANREIVPNIQITDLSITRKLDSKALSRILNNVMSNAIKYSDGDLFISLSAQGVITFSNTAKNLTEVQVGKLFDRFYTVESARKSTGLGLSIAKLLTEQMGGIILAQYNACILKIIITFPN